MTQRLSINTDLKTDLDQVEQAIGLLQRAGFEVFRKDAERVLYVGTKQDSTMLASYNKNDDYLQYVQRDMAYKLGEELLRQGLITFEVLPPTIEDKGWMATQTEMLMTHRFWPRAHKEYRR